jgi:nuclear pore complex protein Nup62
LFAGKTDNASITTSTAPSTTSESDGSKKGSALETPTTTFKFGSTAGSSNPSTTITTTTEAGSSKATSAIGTAPAPTPTGPPPPLEYQTKTVQEIINSFSEHLENDAIEFVKQAQRVAEWDAVLRNSQAGMEGLTEKISQLLFQQQEVDRTLNAISAYQKETESTLDVVEVRMLLLALFSCVFVWSPSLFDLFFFKDCFIGNLSHRFEPFACVSFFIIIFTAISL